MIRNSSVLSLPPARGGLAALAELGVQLLPQLLLLIDLVDCTEDPLLLLPLTFAPVSSTFQRLYLSEAALWSF